MQVSLTFSTMQQHKQLVQGHIDIERMNWTYLFQALYNHISFNELTNHDTTINLSLMLQLLLRDASYHILKISRFVSFQ